MTNRIPKLDVLEAIVFDFDGVILESAAIKGHAFQELFAEHGEHLHAIREHHLRNLGVSRYQKFEWIYRNLFGIRLTEIERQELGKRYSDLVFEKTADAPFVPGALKLLELLVGRLPLFVASATPQAELEKVIRHRTLNRFFVDIYGSPPCKAEVLREIVASGGFEAQKVLMIGDGLSDLEAANLAGCCFVARLDPTAPKQAFPSGTQSVRSLGDLEVLLI